MSHPIDDIDAIKPPDREEVDAYQREAQLRVTGSRNPVG